MQSGILYGMTYSGGIANKGTAFSIASDGTAFTKLLDFNGAVKGAYPFGSLYSDGTFLYGLTCNGGTNDDGVMFRMMPDGSGYTKLVNFNGAVTGKNPKGHFVSDGAFLYATTSQGGTAGGYGSSFKIMPDGTGFSNLHSFDGYDGSAPDGSFLYDGTFLYATTMFGGALEKGLIFKVMPNGTGFGSVFNFTSASNGNGCYGTLVSDGTFLYGLTYTGGKSDAGVLFKMMPDGSGYTILVDFDYSSGKYPQGSLYFDGTYLYGTVDQTPFGQGGIFKVMPDGTNYSIIFNFDGSNTGNNSGGITLFSDGTYLYGTNQYGGANGKGTAYRIMPDGSNFLKLHDFDGTNGGTPKGLTSDGTALYGMTYNGGANNRGVLYKLAADGSAFSVMLTFDGMSGSNPEGSLIYDGTYLFGMTTTGGMSELGNIFKILPDGTDFTNLHYFDYTAGRYPRAQLLLTGNTLYGTTHQGGINFSGTIFKIEKDGLDFTNLFELTPILLVEPLLIH